VTLLVTAPYGVPAADAVSASQVLTFAIVFWVVPVGVFGLWRQGIGAARLREVTGPGGKA
jgi:hypothetical protein